ncbi:MAG: histidinol-phosphatase [Candidatus Marinimicrobia bacterium]|nr:histidinol-phosphatase [Candidatus Neomarinimicrobiota bacterium]
MDDLFEIVGCIHAHSIYSDGSGDYPKIIQSAMEADLDYLLMSDHMSLKGRKQGYNGWYDDFFLGIGYEIQDPDDQHHYLAFGLEETLDPSLTHQEYIKAVAEKGALGIAAHPFEERDPKKAIRGLPPINWTSLDYPEVKVIEIWNMMSHWMEKTTLRNQFWNFIHPRSFSTHPKQKLLKWWDEVNQTRKVTAVGSVDAHATKIKILGLFEKAVFDYKIMFKSIRTHLLLEQPFDQSIEEEEAENIIYNNIEAGRNFISNYRRGDARGFRFWAENGNTKIQMGETYQAEEVKILAQLPRKADIKVIRNGTIYKKLETSHLELQVPAGNYRLEVEVKNRGWIYTNHIKIRGISK